MCCAGARADAINEVGRFHVHGRAIEHAAFFPDGEQLLVTAADGRHWHWQLHPQPPVKALYKDGAIGKSAFSHDGRFVSANATQRRVVFIDLMTGRQTTWKRSTQVHVLAIAPRGDMVLINDGQEIALRRSSDGALLRPLI